MSDRLPAVLPSGAIAPAASADTYIVPAIVAALGDQASWRYVEFVAANIRNLVRAAPMCGPAAGFFGWCQDRGLALATIRPFDVGEWIEHLQENHGAAGVKQQLAAVRMMFNWLITGQVALVNPAAATRLVSYQSNQQLSGWNLPPLVKRAIGAHCRSQEIRTAIVG
jgi:hypothetical protein